MSNQPAPTRPWFRLASISRPAPPQAPTPTPEPLPPPAPPRPAATVRPEFRQTVQAQPPPPAGGVSSVTASPVSVGRASQPSSPDKKITSSVPNSPVKTLPTATAAGPTASPPKTSTTVAGPTTPPKASTTASVPSSPAKLVGTTTTTPVPTSPAKTAQTTTSVTSSPTPKPVSSVTTNTRAPNPISDTRSPKVKQPTAPPPSPLALPPSQLRAQAAEPEPKIPMEAEQKTVLVQKTIEKPRGSWAFGGQQKDGADTRKPSYIPLNEQKAKDGEPTKERGGHAKKFPSKTEDDGTSVITLAGENKGAFMELIRSPHKTRFQGNPNHLQKRGNSYRIGSDGSDHQSYGSSSGEEGDGKMKEKSKTPSRTMAPMNVFMNSNVQGVNNSILYNSSCTHHDPGVHLSLYTKPAGGGFHVKERAEGYSS